MAPRSHQNESEKASQKEKPTKLTKSTKSTKPNKLKKLTKPTKPAKSTKPTKPTKPTEPTEASTNKPPFAKRIYIGFWKGLNKVIPWHKLPAPIGAFNLLAFRYENRAQNLYDVYPSPAFQGTPDDPVMDDPRYLTVRNSDGLFNSLEQPKMGCIGMRFGRNVPRNFTKPPNHDELMRPNPRVISEQLLQRDKFKPATIVNLLAAAWIQFQVHDWFMHSNSKTETFEVPLPEGDKWSDKKMQIARTQAAQPLDDMDREYPAYENANTHWWDLSQLYGSTVQRTQQLRATNDPDGKLRVDLDRCETFIPRDKKGIPETGFYSNWWIGLEMLHTLFILEHNAICDELRKKYPDWTSDKIFDTARLVNSALSAKIHTVEWTPAILDHPTLELVMNTNWWGLIGEKLHKLVGRVNNGEVLSGIPGSMADQDGVPFSLTEEFISVYRMHPLIPDNIAFFDAASGEHRSTLPMAEVAFENARKPLLGEEQRLGWEDVFYSFGVNYPGAITINNCPNFLRDLHTPDGRHLDLGTIDILRDRERGIPRYNQFRRLFHMPPARDFLALTGGNKELASRIEEIYEGDIESVDLLVGCLSEPLPKGFGFSDTAFRVFILMASRRLKSDRFIATAWNTDVYSQVGMDWVQNNTMVDVLCRHFPSLGEPLRGKDNAFRPWRKVGKTAEYKGEETNA